MFVSTECAAKWLLATISDSLLISRCFIWSNSFERPLLGYCCHAVAAHASDRCGQCGLWEWVDMNATLPCCPLQAPGWGSAQVLGKSRPIAEVEMDDGSVVQVDQQELETVMPAPGRAICTV